MSSTVKNNTSTANALRSDHSDQSENKAISVASGLILDVLKELSVKNAQSTLKMVCAFYNQRITSAFAPSGPTNTVPGSRDTRGQKGPRLQTKSDPRTSGIRSEIKQINEEIVKRSRQLKCLLPDNDDLIVKRNQLFRDLKEVKNKVSNPSKRGD
jgi:hypothetical protein